jgi:UDP-glucose 4-epimerase
MRGRGLALVTGGAGFIGSHLVDRLVLEGWRVRVLDNFSTGRMENIKHHVDGEMVEVVKGDLKDLEVVKSAVEGVDVVFHFAANPEVRVSTTNPEIHFNENVVATFNLLEAMRREGVRELVFASSSSVYGEPDEIPVNEEAPVRPVSVYGASKAACESLIHAYSKLYGVKAVVLRYANVVGPRLKHGVVYDFVVKLRGNPRRLEILGDGDQRRSFVWIDDAVDATLLALDYSNGNFDIYNVGNDDSISVREVADEVVDAMGLKGVEYVYRPILHGVGWPGDVKHIMLDVRKMRSLGWRPTLNSRESVRRTVKALLH